MSVERKIHAQKYHILPRRKSSGNVVQTIITVHEGQVSDNCVSLNESEMERNKFLHSHSNGRLNHSVTNSYSHPDLTKCDETLSVSSSTSSFEDVFMPHMNSDRPVALEEELQARVHKLSGLVTLWKKRCQDEKQHSTSLLQQLHTTQTEYTAIMEHTKDKYHKQLHSLRTELNRVSHLKDKLEKEYTDMQTNFKKSLDQNKKDMETLHSRWRQRNSEIEHLRTLKAQSRDHVSTLQSQVDQLKSENLSLAARNRELISELNKIQTRTENNNTKHSSMTQQPGTMCSCMGQEYRLLFELALTKIKTFESENVENSNVNYEYKDGEEALSVIEKDLVEIARKKHDNSEPAPVHYFSDSLDSCDSTPASPMLKMKEEKKRRIPVRKHSEASLMATRKFSAFSYTGITSATSGFGSLGNISIGHVTHPLDIQTARDYPHGLHRQRAFSEIKRGTRHAPVKKSYTTDDSRITHLLCQSSALCHANDSSDNTHETHTDDEKQSREAQTNNDVTPARTNGNDSSIQTNGNVVPVQICGDNDQVLSDCDTTHEMTTSPKTTSGFGGLRSRRNGITAMPLDVSVQLRMNDVKKSKDFSDLLKKFTKEKEAPDKKFSAIKRLSRKKSKPSTKD